MAVVVLVGKEEREKSAPESVRQSDLIPILGLQTALLGCEDCRLRATCRNPVPWGGPNKAAILMLGESPGENEDITMVPFSGAAGRELDGLLFMAHVDRDLVRISNSVRCHPIGNRDPKPDEVAACLQWTYPEIQDCEPRLIVLMGGIAIRALLGDKLTVEEVHGRAMTWASPWGQAYPVFCTYHPAAGLHNGRVMSTIQQDFRNLHNYLSGTLEEAVDQFPQPHYRALEGEFQVTELGKKIVASGGCSADTEWTPDGKLWCATFSCRPGEAFLVWPESLALLAPYLNDDRVTVTLHFAQADLSPLRQAGISPRHLGDTSVQAYLLSLPQGLKQLARQECGMQMQDYSELVGPYQRGLEELYLQLALTVDVPPLEKGSRKRTVHQKIQRALNDMNKAGGEDIDPKTRWDEWEPWEKAEIVAALGEYPQASLADVPLEEAVRYAARDSDATERVKRELEARLRKWSSFNV